MDMLLYEKKYWAKGLKFIVGIDEAGRGPLAGPVVAASVVFDENITIEGIADSKKLTPKKRDKLYQIIREKALDVSVGIANEHEIDDLNILQATFLAMKRAIGNLKIKPDQLLIDGPYSNIKLYPVETIIKGDNKSLSIAAASIIAKVTRDRIMKEYDIIYPEYQFIKHKGYGTKYHINQLELLKASPIHRKSFKIVKNNLPTYSFYEREESFYKLGLQIIATNFVKNGYSFIDKNIKLSDIDDFIDFQYSKNKEFIYIKVFVQYGNSFYPYEKSKIFNMKNYIKYIREINKEKVSTKSISFNVILVRFIPKNKPLITILENEKIY